MDGERVFCVITEKVMSQLFNVAIKIAATSTRSRPAATKP
jgi:hypothetical protein